MCGAVDKKGEFRPNHPRDPKESQEHMTAQSKQAQHSRQPEVPARSAAGVVEPEAISRRAYELFQERGREPGRELDDWLRAENELKASRSPGSSE